jgi:hypothetical protein
MGRFWPTSSCPEISGQPVQKRILQPGAFRPDLHQTCQKHRRRGMEIGPKLDRFPQNWGEQKRAALYRRGRNRILTNSTSAVILRIERALPVDGQPLDTVTRSNRSCWEQGGYFFLLTAIKRPIMPMITSVY